MLELGRKARKVDDAELNKLMEEMWDEVYFKVEVWWLSPKN